MPAVTHKQSLVRQGGLKHSLPLRGNAKRKTFNISRITYHGFTLIKHSEVSSKGFTLIELLVVISIIGILISLSAVAFQSSRASARDAKRRADLEEIRSGLEIYRTDCGKYPTVLNFGASLTGDGSSSSCSLGNTYLPKIPQDPQSPSYQYNYSPSGSTYALCSHLESQQNSVSGCGSCGPNGPSACRYKVENP